MNRTTHHTLLLAAANICLEESERLTLDSEKMIMRAAANMLVLRAKAL